MAKKKDENPGLKPPAPGGADEGVRAPSEGTAGDHGEQGTVIPGGSGPAVSLEGGTLETGADECGRGPSEETVVPWRPKVLRLKLDVALGHGTRKAGTVLALEDEDGEWEAAEGIGEDELALALRNGHLTEIK
jgi:hypothetical protein